MAFVINQIPQKLKDLQVGLLQVKTQTMMKKIHNYGRHQNT
jgi:hypothetical protein